MRPLEGLLVLDFSTLLPGPMATLLLAEAGAEVVKLERPGVGDELRAYAPRWGHDGAGFALLNRGKRSLALDLKNTAERARLEPLLARADILVEQFRPGVMDRLGLGYATVAAANPRLIYCSITGYGQTGPKRDVAGHDLNYIGDTGLLALGHGDPARPVVPPALVADIAGGAYPAVMNILLALMRRGTTGQGCRLDISMTDNLFPFLYWALGQGAATGTWPGNGTGLVTGGTPRYRLYPTADGRIVAAAPIEDRFWAAFCEAIGLEPALRDDARDPDATASGVAARIAARPSAHWREVFARADCCCSVMATLPEALADPQFAARHLFARRVSDGAGGAMPALPLPLDPVFRPPEDAPPLAAPRLGADNGEYLA
jgi:alpha-methylacyl-CoA racemase